MRINELNKIDYSLSETIRNSDLRGIGIDWAETFVDSMLEAGILRDLPIISTLVNLGKTGIELKNRLFLKKLIYFLSYIGEVPIEKRKTMIDLVNKNSKHKISIGEKLIYILDKCDDHIEAKFIAQFFCAFLEEKISYQEFLRGARIIRDIFIGDLEYFLTSDISEFEKQASPDECPDEDAFPLINAGICGFGYNKTTIQERRYWSSEPMDKYGLEGGEAIIWVTSIGKKIKEVLKIDH